MVRKYPLLIFDSKNEKINGNDLEIVFKTRNLFLIFRTQCKIIDKEGKYSTINHSSGKGLQIELLLEYGRKVNGTPIYLFYNINENVYVNHQIVSKCNNIQIEAFGCSFIDVRYIYYHYFRDEVSGKKKFTMPTFKNKSGKQASSIF